MSRPRPIILTVLDGWGYSPRTEGNAIALARKPNYDKLLQKFPNTLIHTSGPFVGLPEGQMGNSEVGHMTMGAGRIVQMDVTRIDALIASGDFFKNPLPPCRHGARPRTPAPSHWAWSAMAASTRRSTISSRCCAWLAKIKSSASSFTASPTAATLLPKAASTFIEQLENKMRELGVGRIASISGRYYAMDRDNRWERIEKAYNAMVHGRADAYFTDPTRRHARQLRERRHR